MNRCCSLAAFLVLLVWPAAAAWAADAEEITAEELAAIKAAEEARIAAIDRVYGSVVAIYGNDRGGGGSGVLYDPAGYTLTNHHVVAGAGVEGWAGLADGKLYRWRLIGTDPGGDVAIIQLLGQEKFLTAPLADSEKVRVGDWAMAMGNPFVLAEDQRPTVTLGIVSGVHRYQPGQGMNQLVYGNCIQVDSSINPGNSGGPLFNLRGEVIGINGRGSFEERGRVNVGLGYAISSNQVRNFIPELLSTKLAQHGTLDAQFVNRDGAVICQSINLDSPAAKAGLELADRLIAFEGVKIKDANQFTNLITIFPAGWPVTLTFEREKVQRTITVRLTALPYEPIVKEPRPAPKPEDKKPEDKKPDEPKPAESQSNFQPGDEGQNKQPGEKEPEGKREEPKPPPPQIRLPGQRPNFGKQGQIRDPKLNASIARELVGRWQSAGRIAPAHGETAVRMISDIFRKEEKVGSQTLVLHPQGYVLASYDVDGKTTTVGFDGKTYWMVTSDKSAHEITAAKAHRDPHFAQGVVLAGLLQSEAWQSAGKLSLDGSDKAAGRLCYRFKLTDSASEELFVWLSVVNDQLQPEIRLVKTGGGIDDDEPIPSTLYRGWQRGTRFELPRERTLVRGLAEEEILRVVATQILESEPAPHDSFHMPKGE
jgi:serine protease Do